jgi:hypothetical protein
MPEKTDGKKNSANQIPAAHAMPSKRVKRDTLTEPVSARPALQNGHSETDRMEIEVNLKNEVCPPKKGSKADDFGLGGVCGETSEGTVLSGVY